MEMYKNGQLVWGHILKTSWWPGLVFPGPMAGKSVAKPGSVWIIWFQDLKISEMKFSKLENFATNFRKHTKRKYSTALEQAIIEALEVCAQRAGLSIDNIKQWGLDEEGFVNLVDSSVDILEPKSGSEFPARITNVLKEAKTRNDIARLELENKEKFESHKLKLEEKEKQKKKDEEEKGEQRAIQNDVAVVNQEGVVCQEDVVCQEVVVYQGGVVYQRRVVFQEDVVCHEDEDVCLPCGQYTEQTVSHPIFEGYLCCNCKDNLLESLLAQNMDGSYMFCCVCGHSSEMYSCGNKSCGRSFCQRCLKKLVSPNVISLIEREKSYVLCCMLCTKYSAASLGKLVPRDCWREELVKFFNPVSEQVTITPEAASKRKIRVLVLFHGAERVKHVLDELALDFQLFYVETNVYSLTKDKLQRLCPIDLVVGFPPWYDLDITNMKHEGFNGTGIMSIKFSYIVQDITMLCQGMNHVYWLVESTASMCSVYRNFLSSFFEREPCMWDTQFFSPHVHLPKLYWGNIPNLYSSFQYYKEKKGQFSSLSLESSVAASRKTSSQVKRSFIDTVMDNKRARKSEADNMFETADMNNRGMDTNDIEKEDIKTYDSQEDFDSKIQVMDLVQYTPIKKETSNDMSLTPTVMVNTEDMLTESFEDTREHVPVMSDFETARHLLLRHLLSPLQGIFIKKFE